VDVGNRDLTGHWFWSALNWGELESTRSGTVIRSMGTLDHPESREVWMSS
jgi:hypothetical protein